MIIKLKAVVICDNCDTEVECMVPLEFDRAEWSSRYKRPEIPTGRVVFEHYGREEMKYLCAKCEKNLGYDSNDYDGGG